MSRKPLFVAGAILLIAALGSSAYFIFLRPSEAASTNNELRFVADEHRLMGWWASPNTNAQAEVDREAYNEEQFGSIETLPVADLAVHHNTPDGKTYPDNCFISYSYYDYPLSDVAASYSKKEAEMNQYGSAELLSSSDQSIATPRGSISYELRSYHVKANSSGQYLSGLQIGYAPLDEGHIFVQSVCKTPEDSALTLPLLSAVRLSKAEDMRA